MAVDGIGGGSVGTAALQDVQSKAASATPGDNVSSGNGILGARTVKQVKITTDGEPGGATHDHQQRAVKAFKLGLKGAQGLAKLGFHVAKGVAKLGFQAAKLVYKLSRGAAKAVEAHQKAHSTSRETHTKSNPAVTRSTLRERVPSSLELHAHQEAPVGPTAPRHRSRSDGATPSKPKSAPAKPLTKREEARARADKVAELQIQKQNVERLKAQLKAEGGYSGGKKDR